MAMRVLLVTSEGACGIAEHSAYLKEAVEAADPSIEVELIPVLHPHAITNRLASSGPAADLVWLNYHAALHSQWTPEYIRTVRTKVPVGVTWHDTGVPNSDHCTSIHAVADAFVVHEPAEDLPGAIYWRQGVPARKGCWQYEWQRWPVLGSVGFPFGWKNFDLLAEATATTGWSLHLIAPNATHEQITGWIARNPRLSVEAGFLPRDAVVSQLSGCDATAFVYHCHNTGTSGAIRQGIAARKPLIASEYPFCRQNRDLWLNELGRRAITWVEPNYQALVGALSRVRIAPLDAGMVALAAQDSWMKLGHRYAKLYKDLCG
ncbi:MAG TPA: hypothetical protein VFE84_09610 [Patescibacteria group bacterium]|nr:hypothetical protein [Patescibacteria group bacterium]